MNTDHLDMTRDEIDQTQDEMYAAIHAIMAKRLGVWESGTYFGDSITEDICDALRAFITESAKQGIET